jgi:DnaJ-class molecular chaperone with C-terminal Zn finger domain
MTTCPTCKGSGRTKGPDMRMHTCDTCGGKGTVPEKSTKEPERKGS